MKKLLLQKDKIVKATFITSILFFVFSVVFKLVLCGNLAVKNAEFEKYILDKKTLTEKISRLTYLDSDLSSISLIEQKAKKLGFVEMTDKVLSLNTDAASQVAILTR